MTNFKTLFSVLFILFFSQNVFSQATKTLDSADYKMNYPADWTPSYVGGYGAALFIFSPNNDKTEFQENISLTIIKANTLEYKNIRTFTEFTISSFETYIKDLDLKSTVYDTTSAVPSSMLEYSGNVYNEMANFYQKTYFKNHQFYILTYTFKPESDKEYLEKAIKAIDSFEVK